MDQGMATTGGPGAKRELRASMMRLLRGFGEDECALRGVWVADKLSQTAVWRTADVLLVFLSMPHELDTAPLIRAARTGCKRVAVPLIQGTGIRFLLLPEDPQDLPRDRWGIPVPHATWPVLDLGRAAAPLVAAPGLAFDRSGNRLGRGGGFYDRFLLRARGEARGLVAIGVCFSEQLVAAVPHAGNDQRLDGIATDREVVMVAGA
jgi:5-formyltetrahydrofolate cyclo-ligase